MFPFRTTSVHEDTKTHILQKSEMGYPWLFFYSGRSWQNGLIMTLLITGLGSVFYIWYSLSGNNTAPSSMVGLLYAVVGTVFLVLAAVLYTLRRRLRKRAIGQLNASLNWHMFFAILGLAMILMHSFGNFHLISGTFALYGMIAMAVSGFIGRALDRLMPRLIAAKVASVLTEQGEDRVTTLSQKLQTLVVHNPQKKLRGFKVSEPDSADAPVPVERSKPNGASLVGNTLHTPWDLAYISLELTQQELDRNAPHYRFLPDKKSGLNRLGALMLGAEEHIAALQDIHGAMQRELFYRYVIRYWRVLHVFLAFVTIGLVIWHLMFAAELLLPTLFHP